MKYEIRYDTPWLLDLIEAGETREFLFFWGHHAKADGRISKSCFSQWWPSKFKQDGDMFLTAEHWMMAQKAKLFGDDEIYEKIITSTNPKAVKALGRKVSRFDPKTWDQEKFDIVLKGNFLKFNQNDDLKAYLLSTGDAVILEASPVDDIWGIGLAQDHEDALSPAKWRGPNLLGYALMSVRDLLKG